MSRVYYPYEEFRNDLKTLTAKIDREFDAIVCIARGGNTIAHLLGEYYNIREVYGINTIGYEDTTKHESVTVFNLPDLGAAKHVLLVDDIVDTGDTLLEVLSILESRYEDVSFYTAALFYKKSAKMVPTWYVKEPDGWIDFFWSVDLK